MSNLALGRVVILDLDLYRGILYASTGFGIRVCVHSWNPYEVLSASPSYQLLEPSPHKARVGIDGFQTWRNTARRNHSPSERSQIGERGGP